MIRLIQRKLIIPRGDTGSFSVPTIAAASNSDVAVFTIFDCLTRAKVFQKTVTPQDSNLVIEFTHNDTVNLPPGRYVWDIKFYKNPQYADDELVNGDEIDSYYAGYSLPSCEIRETGDDLLTMDGSPETTLTPESLDILSATIAETAASRDAANAAADSAGTSAATASEQADAASTSATNAAASATNAASSADAAAASATSAANSASAADTSANAASTAQIGAETAASNAATSAQQAEAYAGQITGLSAQAQTLNAGSAATASYDAATGVLDLGIPKGTTFTPNVAADGTISWTNDGSLVNPASINIRGPQGLKGDPFTVQKTFASIAEMQAYSGSDVVEGDFVVISSTIDDPDNAKLFLKAANGYTFITDLSGAEGIKGDTGNGIQSIVKTGTSGLTDTYTITYTNGNTFSFSINNGVDGSEYTVLVQDTQPTEPTNKLWISDTMGTAYEVPTVAEMNATIAAQIDDTAGDGDTDKTWSADKIADELANASNVQDVQVNGVSVLNAQGVANVPIGGSDRVGVVSVSNTYGTQISSGQIRIYKAESSNIKLGSGNFKPIVPSSQHEAAFYGIAAAAGDTTQSASSNAVGAYTETAKSKISEMLSAPVSVSGTTPTITAKSGIQYVCGEVSTLDITLPASGIVDVVFTSGSTPTVLTITPQTGMTVEWANGFDSTSLEADTMYELNIKMVGTKCLGVAVGWT